VTKAERSHWFAFAAPALLLVGLTVAAFADVIFLDPAATASSPYGDGFHYFARIRRFAFDEIAQGNLPLWNPFLFAGTPLLGGFQAGLFYPPNLLYLALPIEQALDVDLALHVSLAAVFTLAWARSRGLSPLAALLSAAVLAFGGSFFVRVLAGQASLVAAMTWAPLLLLAVDRVLNDATLGWTLVGILAVALQLLAGYPACVHATALAVALHALPGWWRSAHRGRCTLSLAAIGLVPLLLAAVQILPGLETAAESVRSGGVPYEFATSFSFPPENFITLLVPTVLGDITHLKYWGRWFFWDATLFLGVIGLLLAIHGALRGGSEARHYLWVALALTLIALGRYTPLYTLLYEGVPGLDRFRAPSKFLFQASLFTALLAGFGADRLLASGRGARRLGAVALAVAVPLAGTAIWLHFELAEPGAGAFGRLLAGLPDRSDTGGFWLGLKPARFAPKAGAFAIRSLWIGVASTVVVAALLLARRRIRFAAHVMVLLGVAEVFAFAVTHRDSFGPLELRPLRHRKVYARVPQTERVFERYGLNRALDEGVASVWGYDPVILRRYAEFMARAQPEIQTPLDLTTGVGESFHPRFDLLRCRVQKRGSRLQPRAEPLPHLLLIRDYRVTENSDDTLETLFSPDFEPAHTVLLEREPEPAPQPGGSGDHVELLDASTDHLSIAAELASPALLLITDAYSAGWRAATLAPPAPQARYEVLAADHVLRAIPLAAGTHRLRVEYAPLGFLVGRWLSAASSALFLGAVLFWAVRKRRSAA